MNKKISPLIEYVSESTMACVVTMSQGNLLAMTMGHLLMAAETGIIAGTLAAISIHVAHAKRRWMISAILGLLTGIVDFFVHPGTFGPAATEAIVTGLGAAILSYTIGFLVAKLKITAPVLN